MKKKIFPGVILLVLLGQMAKAQLSIIQTSYDYTIDFDQSMTGINNGALTSSSGMPLMGNPAATGQLESEAWEIAADGANPLTPASFVSTTNSGFNTLISAGQASYGWGAWALGNNHALAVLPAGNSATPGSITLRLQNNTGFLLTTLAICYKLGVFNDKDRANSIGFYYSADNINYIEEPLLTFVSPGIASGCWDSVTKNLSLTNLNWADGDFFFLRWFFQDVSGSGLRDEFLLDDIKISGSSVVTNIPSRLKISGINNGICPSAGEDFVVIAEVVDSVGNPAAVQANTVITISKFSGIGQLTGQLTDTLSAGLHTLGFQGLRYSHADNFFRIKAEASGLAADTSALTRVKSKASYLVFTNFTDTVEVGQNIPPFGVLARRSDHSTDSNFKHNISLTKYSGPGNLLGTSTQASLYGGVFFSDIHLDQAGNYMLRVGTDSLTSVLIGVLVVIPPPAVIELVIPRYFGSKSAAAVNNSRTPFAVCLQFKHQAPLTAYNLQIGMAYVTEATTSFGAGNVWNGTNFVTASNALNGYFSTDAQGNSLPVWVCLQPTGNASRFEAGMLHNLRIGISPFGTPMPSVPMYVSSNSLKALDIPVNPRTAATSDDGAFLYGKTDTSLAGKYVLLFDNTEGIGRPDFCTQIRTSSYTSSYQSDLPHKVDSVWRQLPAGAKGEFAAVIPAHDSLGIRRIETRNTANSLLSFQTDADGSWGATAGTTAVSRRQLVMLTTEEIPLVNTIKGKVIYANPIHSPLDSCKVTLEDNTGVATQSCFTDSFGNYIFKGMPDGTYTLSVGSEKPWGGGNAQDALLILHHFVRLNLLQDIYKDAASVTQTNGEGINSVDALWVLRRFTGFADHFPAGDWFFESVEVTATGSGTVQKDILGICRGDVNGDFSP